MLGSDSSSLSVVRAVVVASLIGLFACGASGSEIAVDAAVPTPDATPGAPRLVPAATIQPAAERVVAIGDFHGDIIGARRALLFAGVIDAQVRWVGGKTVVVQMGDLLDRGDDEEEILLMMARLADEAHAAGGALYSLVGNHEAMNVALDLRYVTAGGYADFADTDYDQNDAELLTYPAEQRGRVAAFRPGGVYARMLAGHNTVMVVGDTLFVHGGILPQHATAGLDNINKGIQRWMVEGGPDPDDIHGDDCPVWSRHYSDNDVPADCTLLNTTLDQLGLARMVVAHTVQDRINAACNEAVWRVDVGLAQYYGGSPAVLEIVGDQVRVIDSL